MAFLKSLDISASALTAQRMRMDVISQNIANATTTRTASGGPYRRRVVVMSENSFSTVFGKTLGGGVKVSGIVEDASGFEYKFDPDHPDANELGFVAMPNVDEVEEIIDMMSASRSYEANVTVLNATKSIAMKALEIGR